MRILLSLLVLFTLCGSVTAHSPLKQSDPKSNATIDAPLEMISLTFGKEARLIKLILETQDGSEMEIDLSNNKSTNKDHTIKTAPILTGNYILKWRALSTDGHPIKGSIPFNVKK